ncbi:MAG: hypothetical protein ACXV8U_07815 [Methylobacter sp.]
MQYPYDSESVVTVLVGHERCEDLFSRADAAMYRSKANGRNRVNSG